MGKEYTVTQSSSGTSDWITLDHYPTSAKYTILVELGGGTMTYDVEFCITDPASTPTAIQHEQANGKTADFATDLFSPARGFRLNVTSYTSGTATLTVLEGDQ